MSKVIHLPPASGFDDFPYKKKVKKFKVKTRRLPKVYRREFAQQMEHLRSIKHESDTY